MVRKRENKSYCSTNMHTKGDVIEVEITDFSTDGEGIGKTDAFTWFIKDTVIGDRVSAIVMKCKKTYGYARLIEVITPSEHRIASPCNVSRACGGCQLQNMSYQAELSYKQGKVVGNLRRIGGFHENTYVLEDIIGMEEPIRYRNKAVYPIGRDREGNLVAGFFARRTHSIVPVDDCIIGASENKEILDIVLGYMNKYRIEPYNEELLSGRLRHVLIRKGFTTGQFMVCVVINSKTLPHSKELVSELLRVEGMSSISLSINMDKTNVIMGRDIINLYGKGYIYDYIGRYKFRISPLSFFQVNPAQTVKLYNKVLEYADLQGNEVVWDLYCGIGTISIYLAENAGAVYGIEIIEAAIDDARENARINNIDNATFYVGKVEEVLPGLYMEENTAEEPGALKICGEAYSADGIVENNVCIDSSKKVKRGKYSPDVMVVDPPRKGCDTACLDTMILMKPARIVYVSCDSATLARDLRYLCDRGYELRKVQVVDQFARGVHVETVALLFKLNVDKQISVEVTMDELLSV